MGKGKRYNTEKELNIKKVFAVIIAIIVIVMFVYAIRTLLQKSKEIDTYNGVSYYTVFSDNKYGVIDSEGNKIIEPAYKELIVIPDHKRDIFIITYDVNYENDTYKTKVLNKNNEEIFTGYDLIEAIDNYDIQNNIWYEENVLRVKKDEKYGLINFNGKEILKCEYDEISSLKTVTNSIIVQQDGKCGIVDNNAKKVVNIDYIEIKPITTDYKSGYIVKNTEGKYGVVNTGNKISIDIKYEDIKSFTDNDIYAVKQERWILLEKGNKQLTKETFEDIIDIKENDIIYLQEGNYGVISKEGKQIISPQYEDIKFSLDHTFIARQNGKYGIINQSNEPVIDFVYTNIYYRDNLSFVEATMDDLITDVIDSTFNLKVSGIVTEVNVDKGYVEIRVEDNYKYYNLLLEEKEKTEVFKEKTLILDKQDGKYGYIDKDGNIVVDYIYEDATHQNDFGFVAIKKDRKWGSLDKSGNVVVEPTYNLDDNIKIDFIGKWYLGEDLNMNYYKD